MLDWIKYQDIDRSKGITKIVDLFYDDEDQSMIAISSNGEYYKLEVSPDDAEKLMERFWNEDSEWNKDLLFEAVDPDTEDLDELIAKKEELEEVVGLIAVAPPSSHWMS